MAELILAGDVGGTNTRLGVFDQDLNLVGKICKFSTGDGMQLEAQIEQVLKQAGQKVERACLAAAGPVIENVCESTNIGRRYVGSEIGRAVGIPHFTLINDLVANAAGVERLGEDEIVTLLPGAGHTGTRAIVSPGTGLGEGTLVWDGRHHRPIPSEGGHSRFSPTTPLEDELLQFLRPDRGETVIVEDLISGKGIEHICAFFLARGAPMTAALRGEYDAAEPGQRAALISAAALRGEDGAVRQTMDLFVRLLAVEAANMALKVFAIGGVFLGGGIPPKILPLLQGPSIGQTFVTHRTMHALLSRIPLKVILNDDTALEGAALYGWRFGE